MKKIKDKKSARSVDTYGNLKLKNSEKKALVDKEFLPLLTRHNWYLHNGDYVYVALRGKNIGLHNIVFGTNLKQVDHINRNPLDNRLSNLRSVDLSAQNQNKKTPESWSRFKGVDFRKSRNSIRSVIMKSGYSYYLGTYPDEYGAAWAYDMAAWFLYGENACLNFRDN